MDCFIIIQLPLIKKKKMYTEHIEFYFMLCQKFYEYLELVLNKMHKIILKILFLNFNI